MSVDELKKFRSIIEAAEQLDVQKVLQNISDADDEYVSLEIPVNMQIAKGVTVNSIDMAIAKDADTGDSDLAVNYTIDPQVISSDDAMKMFYVDRAFDNQLASILVKAGFSQTASRVSGSEGGMQEEGRASFDADQIGDEVRTALASA